MNVDKHGSLASQTPSAGGRGSARVCQSGNDLRIWAGSRELIDHPHSYREWNIVGQCDVPGFFYLETRFRLNPGEQSATYTEFELCLHECQFERLYLRAPNCHKNGADQV